MAKPLSKEELTKRLNRVAGQVAGVQRMVAEDRYCIEVLDQIAAVRRALGAVGLALVSRHLETCVLGQGSSSSHRKAKPMSREELLAEVEAALRRMG